MKKIFQLRNVLLFVLMIAALVSCKKEQQECPGSISKDFNATGFNRVVAGDVFRVSISKGTNYSVKATGCALDLNDLEMNMITPGNLEIRYKKYRNNRFIVDVNITMPTLTAVTLSGVAKADVKGFQGQSSVVRAILSGESIAEIDGLGANMNFEISGNAKLNVAGTTENLYGQVSGNGELHAYNVITPEADLICDGNAKAYVVARDVLYATATGNGRIYYKGSPVVHKDESGNGKVIRE